MTYLDPVSTLIAAGHPLRPDETLSAHWHVDSYNTQASKPDPMAAELWRLLS